jgi:hypothetical protein
MRNANHVVKPHVIIALGAYLTRCGETVVVDRIDRGYAYGRYPNGINESWDICGRLFPTMLSDNDVVKRLDDTTVEVDLVTRLIGTTE